MARTRPKQPGQDQREVALTHALDFLSLDADMMQQMHGWAREFRENYSHVLDLLMTAEIDALYSS